MKYLFNLICLLVAQKTYSAYLWLCSETLPNDRDCNYDIIAKKIKDRVKIFKTFLDATRLSPKATGIDKINEDTRLKEVEDDIFSKYYDKMKEPSST